MPDGEHHRVDLVVAKGLALFRGFQLGRELEDPLVPAEGAHQHLHRAALTGPGVSDVYTLTFEIGQILDPGICPGNDRERLRMDGEYGTKILECACILELRRAVIGMILPIGLRNTEIKLAGLDCVDVVYSSELSSSQKSLTAEVKVSFGTLVSNIGVPLTCILSAYFNKFSLKSFLISDLLI